MKPQLIEDLDLDSIPDPHTPSPFDDLESQNIHESDEPAAPNPNPPHRGHAGLFARRTASRLSLEQLLRHAAHLPNAPRALITAYFDLGMSASELAALHHLSIHQTRRLLDHWRDTLSDPCFLLAVQFAQDLPRPLAQLARAHWLEGLSLRQLAASHHSSLHRIRTQISLARSLLLLAMSRHQEIPPSLAHTFLTGPRQTEPRPSVTRP